MIVYCERWSQTTWALVYIQPFFHLAVYMSVCVAASPTTVSEWQKWYDSSFRFQRGASQKRFENLCCTRVCQQEYYRSQWMTQQNMMRLAIFFIRSSQCRECLLIPIRVGNYHETLLKPGNLCCHYFNFNYACVHLPTNTRHIHLKVALCCIN